MQLKKISNRMFKIKLTHKEVLKYYGSYSIFSSSPRLTRKKTEKIAKMFLKNKLCPFDLEIKIIKDYGAEIIVLKSAKKKIKHQSKDLAICFKNKNDFLDFIKTIDKTAFAIYSYKSALYLITKSKNINVLFIKEYSNNFTTDNVLIAIIKEYGKRLK